MKQRLGGYIRLSIEERLEAVSELINGQGYTQQETADILGIAQSTVSDDLSKSIKRDDDEDDDLPLLPPLLQFC